MELIEFQHCLDEETAEETIRVLEANGIPFRRSSGRPAYDVSTLGGSSQTANHKIIISIDPGDYRKARSVMETEALQWELPPGHHLQTASLDELQEIVSEADDWSPFDVAHARRLLGEMGMTLDDPEVVQAKRLERLKEGKKASPALLGMSVLLPILGLVTSLTILSAIGCGIALSIALMRTKTIEGRAYTYDERSRRQGHRAAVLAVLITFIGLFIWGRFTRYGDYNLYVPW